MRKQLRFAWIALSALTVASAALAALLLFTPVVYNLWSLVTGRGFIIPEESSIFTFEVTEMNSGSGEWWLYGEDAQFFYAQGDRDGLIYIAFPRSKASECPSFQRHDWTTWCVQFERLHEST
jgi:hypothetical protein